jgi:hypothetical protein
VNTLLAAAPSRTAATTVPKATFLMRLSPLPSPTNLTVHCCPGEPSQGAANTSERSEPSAVARQRVTPPAKLRISRGTSLGVRGGAPEPLGVADGIAVGQSDRAAGRVDDHVERRGGGGGLDLDGGLRRGRGGARCDEQGGHGDEAGGGDPAKAATWGHEFLLRVQGAAVLRRSRDARRAGVRGMC